MKLLMSRQEQLELACWGCLDLFPECLRGMLYHAGRIAASHEADPEDAWYIGFGDHRTDLYIDLNICGKICYLLSIEIPPVLRGQGYGHQLYAAMERLATAAGCTEIRQTPSGRTHKGGTRREYLNRRGWIDDGLEVMKTLESLP